ncbi:hypothetical protein Ancab_001853 [Ancistrocladus abbreviatus]
MIICCFCSNYPLTFNIKMWRVLCISFLLFMSCCFGSMGLNDDQQQVPCLYIFGDSLSDNGNNNRLKTTAKANYPPYGIDFLDSRATGRFTNDRTMVDVIAELLGFEQFIPPFADVNQGIDVTKGVNYASGGAGIRDETGYLLGERIPLTQQVLNHLSVISRIASVNGTTAKEYLKKCLYIMTIGSNDYINNYYARLGYTTQLQFTPEQYATTLVLEYSNQIKTLYANGARKMALSGLGLLGCTLGEISLYGASNGSGCVEKINNAVMLFNNKLISLVDELNCNFTDAKFTYLNTTAFTPQGFKVTNASCCEVWNDGMCIPYSLPCLERSEYFFWDLFHPTTAVNVITGQRVYKAQDPSYAHPVDISELANLSLPN